MPNTGTTEKLPGLFRRHQVDLVYVDITHKVVSFGRHGLPVRSRKVSHTALERLVDVLNHRSYSGLMFVKVHASGFTAFRRVDVTGPVSTMVDKPAPSTGLVAPCQGQKRNRFGSKLLGRRSFLTSLMALGFAASLRQTRTRPAKTQAQGHLSPLRQALRQAQEAPQDAATDSTLSSWLTQLESAIDSLILWHGSLSVYPDHVADSDLVEYSHQVREALEGLESRLNDQDFDSLLREVTGRHPWAIHLEHGILNGCPPADIRPELNYLASVGEQGEVSHLSGLLAARVGA